MRNLRLAALCVAVGSFGAAQAQLFGFETVAGGSHTSFSETSGGVTATFSQGGDPMDIVGNPGVGSWGSQSLLPYTSSATPVTVDFSVAIYSASIQASDYNADADDLYMIAYAGAGGTGAILDSDYVFWDTWESIPDFATLGVSSLTPILSVQFYGSGHAGLNNMYWDNLEVVAVPEPATLSALGLAALALVRRRKSA